MLFQIYQNVKLVILVSNLNMLVYFVVKFHLATSTFILHLNQGQQLQVQNKVSTIVSGTHTNGAISSWFQEYLLYPD